MKKQLYTTAWPYTFAMAIVNTVDLEPWTVCLHITLAAGMQPPELLRAKGWWHVPPRVTVTCTPVTNMDEVSHFFARWPQHRSQGEVLNSLALDSTRSTPVLQCLALQWDRTLDEVRIFCTSIVIEPEKDLDDEAKA